MYFYRLKGKQVIDFRGDFILSHNPDLVRARVATAAPGAVKNVARIVDIPNLKFGRKLRAVFDCARFIFGKSQALTAEVVENENGLEPAVVKLQQECVCGQIYARRSKSCPNCGRRAK